MLAVRKDTREEKKKHPVLALCLGRRLHRESVMFHWHK